MTDRSGTTENNPEDDPKAQDREGRQGATKGQRNPPAASPTNFPPRPPPSMYYPHSAYYLPGAYGYPPPPPHSRQYFPYPPSDHYGYYRQHPRTQTPQSSSGIGLAPPSTMNQHDKHRSETNSSLPSFRHANYVTPGPHRSSVAPPGYMANEPSPVLSSGATFRPSVARRDHGGVGSKGKNRLFAVYD
jgi:hypothetical protein